MVPGVDCLPRKITPRAIQVLKVSTYQCRQNLHPAGGAPEAAGAGGAGRGLRAQLLHLRRPRHAATHHPLPGAWLRRCECSELEECLVVLKPCSRFSPSSPDNGTCARRSQALAQPDAGAHSGAAGGVPGGGGPADRGPLPGTCSYCISLSITNLFIGEVGSFRDSQCSTCVPGRPRCRQELRMSPIRRGPVQELLAPWGTKFQRFF